MKLCLALDLPSTNENLALAKKVQTLDLWVKVGLAGFLQGGQSLLGELKNMGFKIFLDLKLYDIPNTMSEAMKEIVAMEIDMTTVHLSAGKRALSQISNVTKQAKKPPIVLGVSALTSFSEDEFKNIYNKNINQAVVDLGAIGMDAGLNGLVCSVFELELLRKKLGSFIGVCPAIRFKDAKDDQSRVCTPDLARTMGADFIVVGRPIYQSLDPYEQTKRFLKVCD